MGSGWAGIDADVDDGWMDDGCLVVLWRVGSASDLVMTLFCPALFLPFPKYYPSLTTYNPNSCVLRCRLVTLFTWSAKWGQCVE